MSKGDDELIAEFIATRGVTRLPPGVCAPTQHEVSAADRAFHAARGIDPEGDKWRARHPARRRRRRSIHQSQKG